MPRPDVPEPHRRQDIDRRGLGTAIGHVNADQDVFGVGLRVFDLDVEVPIAVEHAGVHELVLGRLPAAPAVFVDEIRVRKRRLRILVEELHVRVGRRAVDVEVVLLHVLAVIAFAAGQTEQALLQNRIAPVPERQREADSLMAVADAGQPGFVPPVRARSRVIVREVVPRRPARAVVLADAAPGAVAEVRSPTLPVLRALAVFLEADVFSRCAHGQAFDAADTSGLVVIYPALPNLSRVQTLAIRCTVCGQGGEKRWLMKNRITMRAPRRRPISRGATSSGCRSPRASPKKTRRPTSRSSRRSRRSTRRKRWGRRATAWAARSS